MKPVVALYDELSHKTVLALENLFELESMQRQILWVTANFDRFSLSAQTAKSGQDFKSLFFCH